MIQVWSFGIAIPNFRYVALCYRRLIAGLNLPTPIPADASEDETEMITDVVWSQRRVLELLHTPLRWLHPFFESGPSESHTRKRRRDIAVGLCCKDGSDHQCDEAYAPIFGGDPGAFGEQYHVLSCNKESRILFRSETISVRGTRRIESSF